MQHKAGSATPTQIAGILEASKILNTELQKHEERRKFLTGKQKGWILSYLHGATGKLKIERTGNVTRVVQCGIFLQVVIAVERGELPKDFDETDLLEWADEAGLPMTSAALEALTASTTATPTADAGATTTSTADDGDTAAPQTRATKTWGQRLGIKNAQWADLTLTVTDTAIIVSYTGHKAIIETWAAIGFPNLCRPRELLMDLQYSREIKPPYRGLKNVVSKARRALKDAAGITDNPLIFKDGTVTRVFLMGNESATAMPETSEEDLKRRVNPLVKVGSGGAKRNYDIRTR